MNSSPVEFQVDFLGFAFCNKRPLSGWKGHGSQTKNKRKRNLQREAQAIESELGQENISDKVSFSRIPNCNNLNIFLNALPHISKKRLYAFLHSHKSALLISFLPV